MMTKGLQGVRPGWRCCEPISPYNSARLSIDEVMTAEGDDVVVDELFLRSGAHCE